MQGAMVWVSPKKELVVEHYETHIGYILKNPEKFGLTRDYLEKVYKEHGEPIGMEGNARIKIMLDLMGKGWIRIREYRNHWIAEGTELYSTRAELLNWAVDALVERGVFHRFDQITVSDLVTNKVQEMSIEELLMGHLKKGGRMFGDVVLSSMKHYAAGVEKALSALNSVWYHLPLPGVLRFIRTLKEMGSTSLIGAWDKILLEEDKYPWLKKDARLYGFIVKVLLKYASDLSASGAADLLSHYGESMAVHSSRG